MAGIYTIEAEYADKRRSVRVKVSADLGKPANSVIAFPGKPWDGIWPSDEEERGARRP